MEGRKNKMVRQDHTAELSSEERLRLLKLTVTPEEVAELRDYYMTLHPEDVADENKRVADQCYRVLGRNDGRWNTFRRAKYVNSKK